MSKIQSITVGFLLLVIVVVASASASITVLSPNGGETWNKGTSYPITWSYTGSIGSNVNVALFRETTFLNYLASNVPIGSGGSGSYTWLIPAGTATGSNYKIGVQSSSYPGIYDLSNTVFTIGAGVTPTITVTSPNDGESWALGSTHDITWTSSGDVGANVKIEVLKAGLEIWSLSSTPNDGTFSWTIPLGLEPGTGNRIRITSTTNTAIKDSSNADFTITPAITTPTITVTSPNGGESWALGSTHDITWTSSGDVGSSVDIDVMRGGVFLYGESTPNDGTFSWTIQSTTIPGEPVAGTEYRIQIRSTTNPAITDSSNADFTITQAPTTGTTHFGEWQELAVVISPSSHEYSATAVTDGIVTCVCENTAEAFLMGKINGQTVAGTTSNRVAAYGFAIASITMPVRKGDSWVIMLDACSGSVHLRWLPLIP